MADFDGDESGEPVHTPMGATTGIFDKTHAVSATQLTTAGNRIFMGTLPVGAVPYEGRFISTDLDSNCTPLLTITIGTEADDNLFLLVNSTVGRAAGTALLDGIAVTSTTRTVLNADGEAGTKVFIEFTAAPATDAAGTLRLIIRYYDKRT